MKPILVTGGAGYIGSHTVKRLINLRYDVIVYDNLSTGNAKFIDKNAIFINGDLSDKILLNSVIQKYKISAVMHFAASSLVSESISHFDRYFQNNVINGLNLLYCMKKNEVNNMIFSSSASVYGEPKKIPISEEHSIDPISPYGLTKSIFENILKVWDKNFNIKSISLRYFNAAGADKSVEIGELHSPETHLIPNILLTALKKKQYLSIFGSDYNTKDGTCIRDYVHVLDIAEAHILALNSLIKRKESTIYNIGMDKGYSVKEIIEIAREITKINIPIKIEDRRTGDPPILLADSRKIKKELNWKPSHSDISEIIQDAWNWYISS